MALRALGGVASRRVTGRLGAMAMQLITGPFGDHPWAPMAAGDSSSPSRDASGRGAGGLTPWNLMPARGKTSGTKRLLDALGEEIEHERGNYKKSEVLQSGPPNGYQLEDIPGNTRLILKKKHKGLEELEIDLLVQDQPPPAESLDAHLAELDISKPEERPAEDGVRGEEAEMSYAVLFNVSVAKGDKSLVFQCESDGAYVDIQSILLKTMGDDPTADYLGPTDLNMQEDLRASWNSYLEERGVTSEMGDYLLQLALDKELREYMAWLEKVQVFVSK